MSQRNDFRNRRFENAYERILASRACLIEIIDDSRREM